MTTTEDLIRAALDVADIFRDGDTPVHFEIRNLVRAVDAYKGGDRHDGCLMCVVRQMTEGTPELIWPSAEINPGDEVTGVVLRVGTKPSPWGFGEDVPFVDLWTWGKDRVRVMCYPLSLRQGVEFSNFKIGDTAMIRFDGMEEVKRWQFKGRMQKIFTVAVTRGHH